MILDVAQQARVAAGAHLRIAVLAMCGRHDAAPELRGHGLHAVTDAKHRNAQIEHQRIGAGRLLLMDGLVTAGQDDAARCELPDRRRTHVMRVQLAVNPRLAHPARDQLCVLRPEVEDQDAVGVNVGHGVEMVPDDERGRRRKQRPSGATKFIQTAW